MTEEWQCVSCRKITTIEEIAVYFFKDGVGLCKECFVREIEYSEYIEEILDMLAEKYSPTGSADIRCPIDNNDEEYLKRKKNALKSSMEVRGE